MGASDGNEPFHSPEVCAPEVCAPEVCAPEVCAPEVCAPEVCAPEVCAPEVCALRDYPGSVSNRFSDFLQISHYLPFHFFLAFMPAGIYA